MFALSTHLLKHKMKLNLSFVLAALSYGIHAQTLLPKKFSPLPLGSVKPSGWLKDQMTLQANGLAGRMHEFYKYISDTDWTGGSSLYSDLEEAASYWFNGVVPTGVLADSDTINTKTKSFLDYVIKHQDSNGWLGPEVGTTKPRYLWGRYPFLLGAIQAVEAFPELTDTVIPSIYKFITLANSMLKNNNQGVEDWGAARWMDFAIALQWLYENHPNGNENLLMDTMKRLRTSAMPWEKIFAPENFPTGPTDGKDSPVSPLAWHGVNVAEGLKSLPVAYRFSGNQSDATAASAAWDIVFKYHGRPTGIFAADEFLAGQEAIRGTELCLVVETMYSGSVLYQVLGDPKVADRVERMTYNALPATITGDMWSRQYLQQHNQVSARNMGNNPFPRDGPYSNVFGLEPNYPCCTVNFPQGWSKFISNAFLVTPDKKSLVHIYLGPFSTKTTLAESNNVTVTVDTQYPFSDVLTTTVTASKAFTYQVRIPAWATKGTISVNGEPPKAVSPSNGLHSIQVPPGTTKFVLTLPADVTTETLIHGAVAVQRGPLHYAYDIPRNTKVLGTNSQQPLSKELQFDPSAPWQYAIDPATLKFNQQHPSTLPSPIFDFGKPPVSISVTACPIDWKLGGDTWTAPPPENPKCTGSNTTLTLTPYGATKLRISEIPVFKR